LPTDGNQEAASKNVALDTAKEEDGLFSSPDIEVDAHGIPTIDLEVEHSVNRLGKKKGINATVLRLDKEDAWKLGKDGMLGEKAWEEPEGTWKGKSFGP
jgi:chitinase